MSFITDWKFALSAALIAFWIWRVVVTPVEVGLVLFATSAGLVIAGMLLLSAWTNRRARERDEHIYPVDEGERSVA
jgi:hypothetical protein